MRTRHTTKVRRALTAVAITTGLVFTVAACGNEDEGNRKNTGSASTPAKGNEGDNKESDPQEPAADGPLAEVTGEEDITLTVNSAVRDEGGFLTVSGRLRNAGDGRFNPATWRGDEQELSGNSASMAGASVVDKGGKKKYLILRDTEGRCLCTKFSGGLRSGEETTWYAQFPAPPASVTKVDFQIGQMPPAPIEISEG